LLRIITQHNRTNTQRGIRRMSAHAWHAPSRSTMPLFSARRIARGGCFGKQHLRGLVV